MPKLDVTFSLPDKARQAAIAQAPEGLTAAEKKAWANDEAEQVFRDHIVGLRRKAQREMENAARRDEEAQFEADWPGRADPPGPPVDPGPPAEEPPA